MPSNFSIIIPMYNCAKMTERCIDSILNNTLLDFEIVLVDNGSIEQISDTYKKKVSYYRLEENKLFSGGCNYGATKAKYSNLCFLNNDTLAMSSWDDAVTFLEENEDVGIVGIKLLYPDMTIQHAGVQGIGSMPHHNLFDHRYRKMPDGFPPANKIRDYQCVTGACIFISKADFDKVQGFSIEYRNGYEDNDLCFKVLYDLHKKVTYYPLSKIIHLENKTERNATNSFNQENHILFCKKWGDKLFADVSIWNDIDRSEAKGGHIRNYNHLLEKT